MSVYLNGAAGSPFEMGGCQVCHGFQGQYQGGDMSVLIAQAPPNSQQAELIDLSPVASVRTVIHRARSLVKGDGHSLREFERLRARGPGTPKGRKAYPVGSAAYNIW